MMRNKFHHLRKISFLAFAAALLNGILFSVLFALPHSEGQNLRDVKITLTAVDLSLEKVFLAI